MNPLRSPLRVAVTTTLVAIAAVLAWTAWRYYMVSPWTRDGRVRVEVVSVAPEVSGTVQDVTVVDNQFVHKGDILFVIDSQRFSLALEHAKASVEVARNHMEVAEERAKRRRNLDSLSVSEEERQSAEGEAGSTASSHQLALADARIAELDLERTVVRSPVNGYVTNLRLRRGGFATAGIAAVSVIDNDSFWIAGYFEETKLPHIRPGDRAIIRLMGVSHDITGHVDSISRGIADRNGLTDAEGLANVDPTFTWVRLAQRIPVRIKLDPLTEDILLAAGQTCTVVIRRDRN